MRAFRQIWIKYLNFKDKEIIFQDRRLTNKQVTQNEEKPIKEIEDFGQSKNNKARVKNLGEHG